VNETDSIYQFLQSFIINSKIKITDIEQFEVSYYKLFDTLNFKTKETYLDVEQNRIIKFFVIYDIILIRFIDENEKRNYHLWKYIINIINLIPSILIKTFYLYFAVDNLTKNNSDYSAFSILMNSFKRNFLYNRKIENLENNHYVLINEDANNR